MFGGSVDTNILARLVLQDDAQQALAVNRLFARHAERGTLLFVPITVVLELEWVLRGPCGQSKGDVQRVLGALLEMVELGFEAEDALEQALMDYEEGAADFAEYLHMALARKQEAMPFWTFDKKAARSRDAKIPRLAAAES
jgi:predicted nucleic-acid-binding protein